MRSALRITSLLQSLLPTCGNPIIDRIIRSLVIYPREKTEPAPTLISQARIEQRRLNLLQQGHSHPIVTRVFLDHLYAAGQCSRARMSNEIQRRADRH
jgi:hypothetical protein